MVGNKITDVCVGLGTPTFLKITKEIIDAVSYSGASRHTEYFTAVRVLFAHEACTLIYAPNKQRVGETNIHVSFCVAYVTQL